MVFAEVKLIFYMHIFCGNMPMQSENEKESIAGLFSNSCDYLSGIKNVSDRYASFHRLAVGFLEGVR